MSKNRHLLFLSSHHGVGASETLWIETAALLAARGVKISALVAWRKRDTARLAPLTRVGIPCAYINLAAGKGLFARVLRRFLPTGAWQKSSFQRALNHLQPTDLIVSEGNDVSALPYLEAAFNRRLPYQVVTHGVNAAEWPRDEEADRLRSVFSAACHSYWVARRNLEEFEFHIGSRLPRASVVWNPVKVSREAGFAWPAADSPLRIACVARMQARPKGHDLLIRALAEPRWAERSLQLDFFGDGENLRGMQRLVEMLGIQDRVRFPGHVDNVADIWRDHHLIAQPSRNEGMPLSLVEALMCGRPALVTDVAGHTELVAEGENGFVAEAATVAHIGAALERAWEQRRHWRSLGETAYTKVRAMVPAHPAADFAERIMAALEAK